MMAKKLKRLGVPVGLDVLPGLPHGFLSFVKVNTGSISFFRLENYGSTKPPFVFFNSFQRRLTKVIVCAFRV